MLWNLISAVMDQHHTNLDLWIGRDLGYGGGRRTGLAFTDDARHREHVERWGVEYQCPTQGEAVRERTATVVWDIITHVKRPIFLWNVFPLHPHQPCQPFTNRQHTAQERDAGEQILEHLIELVKPARLIAVGRNAEATVRKFTLPSLHVRHPSHGGLTEFQAGMRRIYPEAQERS